MRKIGAFGLPRLNVDAEAGVFAISVNLPPSSMTSDRTCCSACTPPVRHHEFERTTDIFGKDFGRCFGITIRTAVPVAGMRSRNPHTASRTRHGAKKAPARRSGALQQYRERIANDVAGTINDNLRPRSA